MSSQIIMGHDVGLKVKFSSGNKICREQQLVVDGRGDGAVPNGMYDS
jgi:hypothetical protein